MEPIRKWTIRSVTKRRIFGPKRETIVVFVADHPKRLPSLGAMIDLAKEGLEMVGSATPKQACIQLVAAPILSGGHRAIEFTDGDTPKDAEFEHTVNIEWS